MAVTTPLELESLYVRIFAQHEELTQVAVKAVEQAVFVINSQLKSIAQAGTIASGGLDAVVQAAGRAALALDGFSTSAIPATIQALDGVSIAVGGVASSLSTLFTQVATQVPAMGTLLSGFATATTPAMPRLNTLTRLLTSLSGIDLTNLRNLRIFASLGSNINFPKVANLTGALRTLIPQLTTISGLNATGPVWLSQLVGLAGTSGLARINALAGALGRLSPILTSMSGIGALPDLTLLVTWVNQLGGSAGAIPLVSQLGSGIRSLSLALRLLQGVNMTTVVANGNIFLRWLNQFNTISPITVKNIRQIGTGLANMAKFQQAGISTLPTINVNYSARMLGGIPPAADAASRAVDRTSNSFLGLNRRIFQTTEALRYLQFGLAGLAAYGTFVFAKTDDALTRTLAHMQDFAQSNRPQMRQGILDISSKSLSSATDLAKGLDFLASRGMNAAMSIEALRRAEDFAVAGNMDLTEATRHLVDIQRAMGLELKDPIAHIRQLTDISDKFVGAAPRMGSTVKQLSEAFGKRFADSLRYYNVSLEEGIALVGLFSDAQVRGAEASEKAGRFLLELNSTEVKNVEQWKAMLGGEGVFDAAGKRRPIQDIIKGIEKWVGTGSDQAQVARVITMGIQNRAFATIQPVLGKTKEMAEMLEFLKTLGGESQRAADMIRRDLVSQLKILWNNISNVAMVIGERIAPVLLPVFDGISKLTQAFTKLNPAFQNLIVMSGLLYLGLRPAMFLLRMGFGFLVAPLMSVVSLFSSMLSIVPMVGRGVWSLVLGMGSLWSAAIGFAGTMWEIFSLPFSILKGAFAGLSAVFAGVATMLVSLLAGVVPFLINLASWLLLLPVLGGALVTIFLAAKSLLIVAAAGIAHIWNEIKGNWEALSNSLSNNIQNFSDQTVSMWKRFKENSQQMFDSMEKHITLLAGFFWNFGENAQVIFKWLGENWRAVILDMGNAFFALVENMVKNLKVIGTVIIEIGIASWDAFWTTFSSYAAIPFRLIRSQWSNILDDMKMLFMAFIQALLNNIFVVGKAMAAALNPFPSKQMADLRSERGATTFLFGSSRLPGESAEDAQARIDKKIVALEKKEQASLFAGYSTQLKGPADFLGDFKTNFSDYLFGVKNAGGELDYASRKSVDAFERMWKAIDKTTDGFLGKLVEPLAGFKPTEGIYGTLLSGLKTTMPPDWFDQMMKWLRPPTERGLEGGGTGEALNKGGPGFQFKQISLERTMLGGPSAENLDFQQLQVQRQIHNAIIDLTRVVAGKEDPTDVEIRRLEALPIIGP